MADAQGASITVATPWTRRPLRQATRTAARNRLMPDHAVLREELTFELTGQTRRMCLLDDRQH